VRVLVALLRVRVQAKQLMRFGATGAAIAELTGVQQWCCVSSELGSECLLELAMAHVANDDDAAAKPVLSKLQSKAPSTQIRRAAQQMLFQETAQAFMKTGSDAANAEFAKLGRACALSLARRRSRVHGAVAAAAATATPSNAFFASATGRGR
jgi:hypothetical protein